MKRLVIILWLMLMAGFISGQTAEPDKSVADRLAQYGSTARGRLKPYFESAKITYPPKQLVFAGFKQERLLEIYATDATGNFRLVRSYPILAASGHAGPKLHERDLQVPEGIYGIESLNPNSNYHLSLRVNYPNGFDQDNAKKEGRTNLGEDIMIHGKAVSAGCLAMGDEAAEDLFVLAAETGVEKIKVILSPVDFRAGREVPKTTTLPTWAPELYQEIRDELKQLPRNPE